MRPKTTMRFAMVLAAGLASGVLGWAAPAGAQEQPPPEAEACIQEKLGTLARISELVGQAQRGCRSDEQCTLVSLEISCQAGCQGAVLASQAGRFREQLAAFDRDACRKADPSCGISPTCAAVEGAVCVEGSCRPRLAGRSRD
jgi:hypothetical protein